jgi:uridine phosphorylase
MREDSRERNEDVPLLTAAKLLEWRREKAGLALPRLPESAILTHQAYLLPRRRPWERPESQSSFSFELRPSSNGRPALAVVRGVGAPATAIAVEELAVAGVRRLVAVDVAGSLVAKVRSGAVVLVARAIACDGTSPHYTGGPEVQANARLTGRLAERLTSAGIAFTTGAVWSTDAIYRETPSELNEARAHGALVADMETACVFAVTDALGIEAAAILVAADELHETWRPPADMGRVQAQVRGVLAVAIAGLTP